jgi:indolepyruvate ferredoxin oxidoreductase beta subunit
MLDAVPSSRSKAGATEDERVIKLAVLAVGGQGGGVLVDWITDVAERNSYVAQSTSVAGVAQRTGATIYYIEMARDTGRLPVFALSPSQGDVDILIAAELMEAGRSSSVVLSPERDADRLIAPHRRRVGKDRARRRPPSSSKVHATAEVAKVHRLRHGEDRRRERHDDSSQPAWRAGGVRRCRSLAKLWQAIGAGGRGVEPASPPQRCV